MRHTLNPVTSMESLEALAEDSGVTVHDVPLTESDAMTVEVEGQYHIGLSTRLTQTERKGCLAHELGHTQYAGLYCAATPLRTRSRIEYRADKWAFMRLCPPGLIKATVAAGADSLFALSQALDLPEPFVGQAVHLYRLVRAIA